MQNLRTRPALPLWLQINRDRLRSAALAHNIQLWRQSLLELIASARQGGVGEEGGGEEKDDHQSVTSVERGEGAGAKTVGGMSYDQESTLLEGDL